MFSALARTSTLAAAKRAPSSGIALRTLGVRGLSDAAEGSSQQHKPLIEIFGTAARYANATYVAASKAGSLATVEAELSGLSKAASESPALRCTDTAVSSKPLS